MYVGAALPPLIHGGVCISVYVVEDPSKMSIGKNISSLLIFDESS